MTEGIAPALAAVRLALADARLALRRTTETHRRVQAEREVAIIAELYGGAPKNMGSNEADRDRQMILDLSRDAEYQAASEALYRATEEVMRVEAELDELLDVRREREWSIREHIADALIGREQIEEVTR
jgi:hypothetical protein